jgi:hypothetical protein
VSECDREASTLRRPWPTGGCCAVGKNICFYLKVSGHLQVIHYIENIILRTSFSTYFSWNRTSFIYVPTACEDQGSVSLP